MSIYVGIDLGTTNSALATFDGEITRVWKSPEQNDVTPSAILFDKRGGKYVGRRAYDAAPGSPKNVAMYFKRIMGTGTKITVEKPEGEVQLTPEECSAEILKTLFSYIPEEQRSDIAGTVITVPAAFNDMQKEATTRAAELAGLGKVTVMQEPVAAVMSVMRTKDENGVFVIFDIGGGTLDVAVAESMNGNVSLLSLGGVQLLGGRDFDRAVVDKVVIPWLEKNFDLPDDFAVSAKYKNLLAKATWASESAKVELSARESVTINQDEEIIRSVDDSGKEIYLDVPVSRAEVNQLISDRITEAIQATKDTISAAGFTPADISRVVFVGGPSNYAPLRERVAAELGIQGSTEVNPMTAVAEGAAIFAESIDWDSVETGSKKTARGSISGNAALGLRLDYSARTASDKGKIVVKLDSPAPVGSTIQVESPETGWNSGTHPLENGASIAVSLPKIGKHSFVVTTIGADGNKLPLDNSEVIIQRTAATVASIPASHSVGIEVLERLGGRPVRELLVAQGESLPKSGSKTFKAAEQLDHGATGSINLKLWAGEITDPIRDNRPVGVLKIKGTDFDFGTIQPGAEIICEFAVDEAGRITLEVDVPSIGASWSSDGHNFYSPQEGHIDYNDAAQRVKEDAQELLERIQKLQKDISDPRLGEAVSRVEKGLTSNAQGNPEGTQAADESVMEAKKVLATVRKENLKKIRQLQLTGYQDHFNKDLRKLAKPEELAVIDPLFATVQRAIDTESADFDAYFDELRGKGFDIVWRQDDYVVSQYEWFAASSHLFLDKAVFADLVAQGKKHKNAKEFDELRRVVVSFHRNSIGSVGDLDDMFSSTNVVR